MNLEEIGWLYKTKGSVRSTLCIGNALYKASMSRARPCNVWTCTPVDMRLHRWKRYAPEGDLSECAGRTHGASSFARLVRRCGVNKAEACHSGLHVAKAARQIRGVWYATGPRLGVDVNLTRSNEEQRAREQAEQTRRGLGEWE